MLETRECKRPVVGAGRARPQLAEPGGDPCTARKRPENTPKTDAEMNE